MPISLDEAQRKLCFISAALSLPLNTVLEDFKPDDFMSSQLAPYLPEWGEKSFHEFLNFLGSKNTCIPEPNVLDGDMEPLNIFEMLAEMYGF